MNYRIIAAKERSRGAGLYHEAHKAHEERKALLTRQPASRAVWSNHRRKGRVDMKQTIAKCALAVLLLALGASGALAQALCYTVLSIRGRSHTDQGTNAEAEARGYMKGCERGIGRKMTGDSMMHAHCDARNTATTKDLSSNQGTRFVERVKCFRAKSSFFLSEPVMRVSILLKSVTTVA